MNINVHILEVSHLRVKNYNYLIIDNNSRDAVLVDPAWELGTLENALHEHEAILTGILVTHSHPDHVNLCGTLAERWQIPVFMSRVEIDYYAYHCAGLIALDNEEPFQSGKLQIIPHFTPGHTKGGICYQINKALFTGDTLFIEGCGLCVGAGSDPYELFASLQKLKNTLTADTDIFPGHSYGHSCGKSFKFLLDHNLYLQFKRAEEFVAFRMRNHQNKANWFNFK